MPRWFPSCPIWIAVDVNIQHQDYLSAREITLIREVPHFKDSSEARHDICLHYRSYAAGFADLLQTYEVSDQPHVIADVGTGYGWLSIAIARRYRCHVIAVDNNESRLQAARRIADILGVERAIDWRVGGLPRLPLMDHEADVTFCVEVIEHVGDAPEVVHDLGRVSKDILIISSPNRNFPVIRHDTGLPFCHWLPPSSRNRYAAFFNRLHLQDSNIFWSPAMVSAALPDFERSSRFLQFLSYRHFLRSEKEIRSVPGRAPPLDRTIRKFLLGAAAPLGSNAINVLPNLASTFRRRPVRRTHQ